MGVCGYTYAEVMDMPMHAIANAISARNKLIRSMIMSVLKFFGAQEIEAPRKNASPMTMQDFDLLFS